MRRAGFSGRQWLILALMALSVVAVFGLLGYSVATTMRNAPPPSPSTSPLSTPTAAATMTATPTNTPAPTATATRAVPLSQLQSARAVRELGRIVAEVRDLPRVEQIPVTFPTENEIATFFLRRYQEEQPQQVLSLYATLGLIPPQDPLPLPDVARQAANISSLYLTNGRQIMLVAGRGPATPEDELALVYALAHALQDNRFGLENLSPCQPTSDATMALRALVEGDALLTTAEYAGLPFEAEQIEPLAQMAADALEPNYASLADNEALQSLRLFPYREGAQFVLALYSVGDWGPVNRAYGRAPCSTEQVLHPEQYNDAEPLQEVHMPDLSPVLGSGWQEIEHDTLGELIIGLHLGAYLEDEAAAWDAAAGWAGDVFVHWENEEGQQLLVWRLAWDDRDEAAAFERAYALLIPRFRDPPLIAVETPYGLSGRFWTGPAGVAYLARAGRIVTVVWGADAATVTAIAAVMP
ncbi:MAG: hypothetical protein JW900_15520 [Anaerolineae bacterium]|nr:hypothetical protein [Anaerolineae bacterium]